MSNDAGAPPGGDSGGGSTNYFRIAHIERIFQNDDPDSDVWMDIERIDELHRSTEGAFDTQTSHWTFDWGKFNPELAAKKEIKDPNDDTNIIEVPIRNSMFTRESLNGQGIRYKFINNATNKARETHSRRVYNHEIKEEYLIGGKPPSDPDTYLESLGEQDIGQYVDVELIDKTWTQEPRLRDIHGQRIRTFTGLLKAIFDYTLKKKWLSAEDDRLLRDPLLDDDIVDPTFISKTNPGGEDGAVVIDPPWRIDPLQNIVNVRWGGLAVIFGPEATDAPKQNKGKTT